MCRSHEMSAVMMQWTNSKWHSSLNQYSESTIGNCRPSWKLMRVIMPWGQYCYKDSWTMTNGIPSLTEAKPSMEQNKTMTYMMGNYSPLCVPSNTGSTTCSAYPSSGTPTTATSPTLWRSRACQQHGWSQVTSQYIYMPHHREGKKTYLTDPMS